MELPDLGKQCAFKECKQLDFLPICCDRCSEFFCKLHSIPDDHNCEHPKKGSEAKEDVDFSKYKCSLSNCSQKELAKIVCPECQRSFCLDHRHQVDHDCIHYKFPKNPMAEADAKIKELAANLSSAPSKKKVKNTQLAAKVQLMRLKGKAIGNKTLPPEERIYFLLSSPTKEGRKETAVFVSHHWSIGRCVDAMADLTSVKNSNNDPSKPILLFQNDEHPPFTKLNQPLKSCIDNKELYNGQSLHLNFFPR